jgi:hypothetical protein
MFYPKDSFGGKINLLKNGQAEKNLDEWLKQEFLSTCLPQNRRHQNF